MSATKKTFNDRLIAVQSELKAPKGQYNNFGKYAYRSAEDILESVKPLLAKYTLSLFISDKVLDSHIGSYIETTATVTDGESKVEVTAQAGIDPNRKGMDIAQSYGSSASYARKYALNGLFLIDDTKDPDSTHNHGKTVVRTESIWNKEVNVYIEYIVYIMLLKFKADREKAYIAVISNYGDKVSGSQK